MWAAHGITCDGLATGPELGEYAAPMARAGYRTGHLPLDPAAVFFRRLRPFLRREGYDVVHTHVERANAYIDAVALSTGARVVQHVHQSFTFDGLLRVERTLQRAALRAAGVTFVAVSEDVAANERRRFANRTTTIENWVDVDHYTPPSAADRRRARAALDVPDGTVALVTVANCHDFKNHVGLIEALTHLPLDVLWLHGGEGPLTAAEQQAAAAHGVADRIRFLGRLADPLPALHAADAYISPSFHEGMTISAMEALVTDLPAVLTDPPGQSVLRRYGPPVSWADGTDAVASAAAGRRRLEGGRPDGDAAALRAAVDPRRAVAQLAGLYRGET